MNREVEQTVVGSTSVGLLQFQVRVRQGRAPVVPVVVSMAVGLRQPVVDVAPIVQPAEASVVQPVEGTETSARRCATTNSTNHCGSSHVFATCQCYGQHVCTDGDLGVLAAALQRKALRWHTKQTQTAYSQQSKLLHVSIVLSYANQVRHLTRLQCQPFSRWSREFDTTSAHLAYHGSLPGVGDT